MWRSEEIEIDGVRYGALIADRADAVELALVTDFNDPSEVLTVGQEIVELDRAGTPARTLRALSVVDRGDRGEELVINAILAEHYDRPPPLDPSSPFADIRSAIRDLKSDEVSHWTTSGAPSASHLSEVLGRRISADDRDAAWSLEKGANDGR